MSVLTSGRLELGMIFMFFVPPFLHRQWQNWQRSDGPTDFAKKKQLKQTEYKMLPDFGRRFEPVAPGISPSTVRNSDKCQCHGFFHCFVHNYRILQFRGIAIVRD
jgi:hypothetical protein